MSVVDEISISQGNTIAGLALGPEGQNEGGWMGLSLSADSLSDMELCEPRVIGHFNGSIKESILNPLQQVSANSASPGSCRRTLPSILAICLDRSL